MDDLDAVIVGARCAGATLAVMLANAGWRVLLIDRDRFPSDTVSTHFIFPDSLQRLEQMGALARLRAAHDIPLVGFSWRVLGHEVAGGFTQMGGFDRATCVRRFVLDQTLIDTAVSAGAAVRLACGVTDVIGAGVDGDPIRGVVLETGETVGARWVFGADGRRSVVARRLGVEASGELRAEQAILFAYWRGLPASEWNYIDVHDSLALMSTPCEDGIHLLSLAGRPKLTRGSATEREARYRDGLGRFPATIDAGLLDHAQRISPLVVAPETMLRGYYRTAAGPGWALVGDAGHFKHPVTAQGIGDAIEQAWYVAESVVGGGDLAGYDAWRDDRAREHYEWSFLMANFPRGDAPHEIFAGLSADPDAGAQWRDLFTKRLRPSDVFTPERLTRWHLAWAYEDGRRRVMGLVADLNDDQRGTRVPACPDWTVRDLVAHLVGVAADTTVGGGFFGGAMQAWRDPDLASARERWTADQVASRRFDEIDGLLRDWDVHGSQLEAMLRRGVGFAANSPLWVLVAPAADLGVHLHDLREALGCPGDEAAAVTRLAFRAYREWLAARLSAVRLPAVRLTDGTRDWILGGGEPAVTLHADRFELFRVVSGRRNIQQIVGLVSEGDVAPYLGVISPYTLPTAPSA